MAKSGAEESLVSGKSENVSRGHLVDDNGGEGFVTKCGEGLTVAVQVNPYQK